MHNKVINKYSTTELACKEIVIKADNKEMADDIIKKSLKHWEIDINYDDIKDDMVLNYDILKSEEKEDGFHYIIQEKLRTNYSLILPEAYDDYKELDRLLSLKMCLNKYPIDRKIKLIKSNPLPIKEIKESILEFFELDNLEELKENDDLLEEVLMYTLDWLSIIQLDHFDTNENAERVGEEHNKKEIEKILK